MYMIQNFKMMRFTILFGRPFKTISKMALISFMMEALAMKKLSSFGGNANLRVDSTELIFLTRRTGQRE